MMEEFGSAWILCVNKLMMECRDRLESQLQYRFNFATTKSL